MPARTRLAMDVDGAAPVLLELHGRLLRLVCRRAGQHFQGMAAAAGWLARHGCRGKALKTMRQLDIVAAWLRHVTAPKGDELVATINQMLDVAGFAAASGLKVRNLLHEVQVFDIFDEGDGNGECEPSQMAEVDDNEGEKNPDGLENGDGDGKSFFVHTAEVDDNEGEKNLEVLIAGDGGEEWTVWAAQYLQGEMEFEVFRAKYRAHMGEERWLADEARKALKSSGPTAR
mmetsp:Transcript_14417/g.46498  ORF Transcript_14417/g.46498 Transcript_14417/m.46498 type:complete len:230 (+) Transcript_14417:1-690(+)